MSCLPCFGSKESEINEQEDLHVAQAKGHPTSQPPVITTEPPSVHSKQPNNHNQESASTNTNHTNEVADNPARNFGFRELAMATKNFRRETLLGESRIGKVYKGTLQGTGQVVAVKQLDRHGTKANKEFLNEVMTLSFARHPNLVEIIGYCVDGDQRILVYEYMEKGSLSNHLHEVSPEREPLDWITRMKIASGAAQALEYLHENKNPPILYRNFTSTNVLLDENLEPKLTDFGLVRLEIDTGNTMQQRMVHTVGCAPEYEQNGELTPKSDVYGFGVVLLELISGRKPLDTNLPVDEQNLTKWAQPYFKEPKRFPEMADPLLKGSFPDKSLNQAVGVAAMCVQEDPSVRPMISDVVAALSFLTLAQPTPQPQPQSQPQPQPQTQPQPQPQSDHATASTNIDHDRQNQSCSSSSNEDSDDYIYSDSDDEDEQPHIRTNNNKTSYDDKGGTSSSESLYNEDDYWEDETNPEETSYRTKSKPSIKRKVTLGSDKGSVSRNSSKGNNTSLKKHSSSSSRKKSVSRKSSKYKERDDVGLSKKSHGVFGDDQYSSDSFTSKNNSSSTRLHSNSSNQRSSKNNEKVDMSLGKKTHELTKDDQSSSKPYESNNKSRSKGEKLNNAESSDSSLSSDSSESSRRDVTLESSRKNVVESDSGMNDSDVEISDGEEINARLLEDTYVPI